MTEPLGPRWTITYKTPEPGTERKTLTIAAPSMVSALKQAQMQLAEMEGRPFKIVMIEVAVDAPDVAHPHDDPPAAA